MKIKPETKVTVQLRQTTNGKLITKSFTVYGTPLKQLVQFIKQKLKDEN